MKRLARIHLPTVPAAIQIILISHSPVAGLIEYPSLRRGITDQVQIIEERCDCVIRYVGRRELLVGVLRAAALDGDVAVGARVCHRVTLRVDLHFEGELDLAETVIFVQSAAVV